MKAFTLSKNSLHYRIATVYGGFWDAFDETDLCTYLQSFLLGLSKLIVLGSLGSFAAGALLGNTFAWILAGLHTGWVEPDIPALIIVGMFAVVIVLMAFGAFLVFLDSDPMNSFRRKLKRRWRKTQNDSFLGLAYQSFKDKTCVKIKLD